MGDILFIRLLFNSPAANKCSDVIINFTLFFLFTEMEIIPEGTNFRLVQDEELPAILEHLKQYLPEAIKVCALNFLVVKFN